MERWSQIIRGIWTACLLLAGLNHARILLQHGFFWDYNGSSPASAVYWTSLTFIDPLVAALLLIRPKIGVPATVFVITTNVAHNLAVTFPSTPDGTYVEHLFTSPLIISQIGFLLFVLATWRMASKDLHGARASTADPARL